MPRSYCGGEVVSRGTYWKTYSGDWVAVGEEGGVLPVARGKYVRASPGLKFLVGPILGCLYWIVLPGVFFGVVIQLMAAKMARSVKVAWRAVTGVEAR